MQKYYNCYERTSFFVFSYVISDLCFYRIMKVNCGIEISDIRIIDMDVQNYFHLETA